ncbi:MAG: adaptor protein MecA [Blautia sp.]
MKIEKINENQIKCTLTREDLEQHQVRLSELAYGTEKAKKLFRDMMQEAYSQFGFEADNIPLMIEAIPMQGGTVTLIITKVEDPEELDTRFAKFAPGSTSGEDAPLQFDGADNIIDIFQKLYDAKVKSQGKKPNAPVSDTAPAESSEQAEPAVNLVHLYEFPDLDTVIRAAHGLNQFYTGVNSLYKDSKKNLYLLVVHQTAYTPEEFNKICNILSEYGKGKPYTYSGEAYLMEHCETILSKTALQQLTKL